MSTLVITKLTDITKLFAHFAIHQYHISFDRKGKVVIRVPKEYLGKTSRILFAYAPHVIQENIVLKKFSPWSRFKIYFKMAFFPLAIAIIQGCASTPSLDCKHPRGVLSPGDRGKWPPGLYIVTSKNQLPLKWCSETEIEWVPSIFKGTDGRTIDMGEGK